MGIVYISLRLAKRAKGAWRATVEIPHPNRRAGSVWQGGKKAGRRLASGGQGEVGTFGRKGVGYG